MTALLLVSVASFAQDETPPPADAPPESPPEAPVEPLMPPQEPVLPPKFEANVELGSIGNTDPVWDIFGEGAAMPSFGLSGGYRVVDRVAIVGAWHHVRRGAVVQSFGADEDADFQPELTSFVAAFVGNELSLGAKADVSIDGVFLPFVQAQALVLTGLVRFDDDLSVDDNPSQASYGSATGGFLVTGGGEFRFPVDEPVQVGIDLELGYGWLAPMSLGDLGRMKPGGFAVRSGVGVRF